jgi:hypothetical protein
VNPFLLALAGLALGGVAFARPQLIEPRQTFTHPHWFTDVAISGDYAVALSITPVETSGSPRYDEHAAHLFHRDATGNWVPQGILINATTREFQINAVSMDGTLLAVKFPSSIAIFERTASGWDHQSTDPLEPDGYQLAVDGRRILASEDRCSYGAIIVSQVDPGRWAGSVPSRMPGNSAPCPGYPPDFELDLSGDRAIVWNGDALYGPPPYEARIFERNGAEWPLAASLPVPSNEAFAYRFGPRVAIRGDLALVSGSTGGTHIYRRNSSGAWNHTGLMPNYDAWPWAWHSFSLDISGDTVFTVAPAIHRGVDAVHVHRERSDGRFEQVAILAAPAQEYLAEVDGDGRHVAAVGGQSLHFFELPATFPAPAPVVQEDFQSGAPTGWSTLGTSRFTIEQDGITRVWRQNSTASTAGAIHEVDWADQSITADVRPLAFQGPDRWVGLVTRYQDESNYYYVTLRDRERLSIKRMVNGQFSTLAETSLLVTPGVLYRLQFESSGSLHNLYVAGRKVLSVHDDALSHGHPGIRMHQARADFDNIVIAPGARRALFEATFDTEHPAQLMRRSGTWSIFNDVGNYRLEQSDTAGTARATVGSPTSDQVLQSFVRITSLGSSSGWAGLMARYTGVGNYYYVKLDSERRVSLRKLVDGTVHVLGSAPPLDIQGPPTLRLEVVGTRLRVFANDRLLLERTDGSHTRGTSGFITHRAAALFDDYIAYQP